MTNPTDCNRLFSDSPNSSNNRNRPTCFKCREQGHMRHDCTNRVFCNHCKSSGHCDRTCKKLRNNTPSPTNSHIPTGYHPTATPPPLNAPTTTTNAMTQPNTNNGPWFHNYQDNNYPRTSIAVHTLPMNNMSPAQSAYMTEAFTNILTQVVDSKKDDGTKQMMKNIKTFDGTNKADYITWLSQIEAAAKFSNSSFRELICQGMAPSMLHVLGELSTTSMDKEIKDVILTNFSDIPSTAEAAARLQNLQMKMNEALVTYNSRYEAIHQVAFRLTPCEQYNKTAIVEYTKKLPQHTKEKLLRKIAKKDSYIRTLGDAFRQAKEIDRESSFVDAAAGRYVEQSATKIDTQINELDDSFQDCNINALNTRSTNRSTDGSFNSSLQHVVKQK